MAAAEIINIDLTDAPPRIPIANEEALVVFWWRDRPVGQAWDRGAKGREIAVDPLADQSVDPEVISVAKSEGGAPIDGTSTSSLRSAVSLVICTRDRPQELARCLASLADQTTSPTEIIVVDNASRDKRSREAAIAAKATYVREDRPGLDYARNAGIRAANGEIVVFTDDDVRLHPRWLERIVA